MALTAEVALGSVTKRGGSWSIALTLTLTEDAAEVFASSFSVTYVDGPLNAAMSALFPRMQAAIDAYKAQQTVETNPTLATAITALNSALVT